MAMTPSTMLPLGTKAPDFDLPDPEGDRFCLADFEGDRALLVMFICNHCPFVKHVREGLADLTDEYVERGVGVVAINSNDIAAYPADAPARMAEEAEAHRYRFPYLFDETQEVAQVYRAACTPDFYLFDADRKLVYRGRMDASRPGNDVPVTGNELRAALDAALAGTPVPAEDQKPSIGCNIKWKPGNEPDYFG